MTKLELINRQEEIVEKIGSILATAESETRKLNEGEDSLYNQLSQELEEVRSKIENYKENKINTENMEKTINFSLIKTLRESRDGQLSPETKAILGVGKEEVRSAGCDVKGSILLPTFNGVDESRSVVVGTEADGGYAVKLDKTNILSPLMNELVAAKLGCRFLTNLTGNLAVPALADIDATWETEIAETAGQSPKFSQIEFSPNRLSIVVPISNTWLEQDGVGAEQAIRNLIVEKIKIKMEQTMFGAAAGIAGKMPKGLFNGATSKGALSLENVVGMEGDILGANANATSYLMHPKLMVKAKTTKIDAGSGEMLYKNGVINGYPVHVTNSVASGMATAKDEYGIVLGDWKDFYVCFWNGIGIQQDPYTLASSNQTRLIINFFCDFKPVRNESFVAYSMK